MIIGKVAVSEQPEPFVTIYFIVSFPAAMPVTTPPFVIVAILVFELLQVPPAVEFERVLVVPTQIWLLPLMVPKLGALLTVTL